MCDICHQTICPSSCPNADDRVIGVCAVCGDEVRRSEDVIIVDGEMCHVDCLEDMPLRELLAFFEHRIDEIEEEE